MEKYENYKLFYKGDEVKVLALINVLTENNIRHGRSEDLSGKLIGITEAFRSSIYVHEDDFDKALSLAESYL